MKKLGKKHDKLSLAITPKPSKPENPQWILKCNAKFSGRWQI
ncbi:hypothetical protein BPUTEOMOX_1075 [methanotrophic endosymbiont of Bathymodiolus puteoserpentis (Logatchev)]|nr:hypothetical protein BPUTEOMOX_1075 [methanotrophic endosymbiont of Bathymodiolus puteoserpentis (Logatchev)]